MEGRGRVCPQMQLSPMRESCTSSFILQPSASAAFLKLPRAFGSASPRRAPFARLIRLFHTRGAEGRWDSPAVAFCLQPPVFSVLRRPAAQGAKKQGEWVEGASSESATLPVQATGIAAFLPFLPPPLPPFSFLLSLESAGFGASRNAKSVTPALRKEPHHARARRGKFAR